MCNLFMRKLLAILLVLIIGCSFAACTKKEAEQEAFFDDSTISALIIDTKTNQKIEISNKLICKDLHVFDFKSFDVFEPETNSFVVKDVESNEYIVRALENQDNQKLFAPVVRNLTDQTKKFEDCELIYLKYSGSTDIKVFGLTIGMTRNEIIDICGTPSAQTTSETSGAVEYQLKKDGCPVGITCLLDGEDKVYQFLINIGNIPIYDHLTGGVEIDTELSEEEIKSAQDAGMPSTFDELPDSAKEEIRKQLEEQNKK